MQEDPTDKAKVVALPPFILAGVLVLSFVLDRLWPGNIPAAHLGLGHRRPYHRLRDQLRSFSGPGNGACENST